MISLFYVQKVRRYSVPIEKGAKTEYHDRVDVSLSMPGLKYSSMTGTEVKMQNILVKLFEDDARKCALDVGQWIVADVSFDTFESQVTGNDYMNCYMNRYVQFSSETIRV